MVRGNASRGARAPRLSKGLAKISPKAPAMLPGDEPNPRSVEGGNKPPTSTALDKLLERRKELIATASAWLNNFSLDKAKPIDTEENAAKLKGFKSQAAELAKEADAQRKLDGKPHRDAIAKINEAYEPIGPACTAITERIEPLLRDWLQREQAKLDAAAKAKREAAEAEARRAAQLKAEAERQMASDLAGSQVNTMETIIAAEEQERLAEAAKKAAIQADKQRAKIGANFQVAGQKRSAYLQAVYTYSAHDPAAAAIALCKLHPEGKPKALVEAIEQIVRYMHTKDRSFTCAGVTITDDQRAR